MDINGIFENVCATYFPRWDRRREWKVVFADPAQRRRKTGYCDSAAKTIYLDERQLTMMPAPGVRAFIIHEICHEVAAARHNRRWSQRMQQAANDADRNGETRVAEILRSDIYSYAGNGVLAEYTRLNVIDYVEDLMGRVTSLDHAAAVGRVARYFGHAPAKVQRDFGRVIEDVLSGVA